MRITALLLLILLLPLTVLVAIALFINSPGNVLFIQERVGKDKKPFLIYKFRTMKNGNIFFVGKIVRKLGLDEIPQFVNIAKAEMAFVGPRPLTKFDIERLGWTTEEAQNRWSVLPGITGPAQLTNICNAQLSLQKDLSYVSSKSTLFDLKILCRSALVPLIGKHTS